MIRFKTFYPSADYDNNNRRVLYSATYKLNEWVAENPEVEIISWNTTAVGTDHELWITIQYKENQ